VPGELRKLIGETCRCVNGANEWKLSKNPERELKEKKSSKGTGVVFQRGYTKDGTLAERLQIKLTKSSPEGKVEAGGGGRRSGGGEKGGDIARNGQDGKSTQKQKGHLKEGNQAKVAALGRGASGNNKKKTTAATDTVLHLSRRAHLAFEGGAKRKRAPPKKTPLLKRKPAAAARKEDADACESRARD